VEDAPDGETTHARHDAAMAITTESPVFTPSLAASSEPSNTWNAPGFRAASAPLVMRSPRAETCRSYIGSAPRTVAAFDCPSATSPMSSASPSTKGAAAATRGLASACCRNACQFGRPAPNAVTVACDVMLRMRSRSSFSKPFITESTTMSTATPMATPTIDMTEMNDRKRFPVERR
jgi:hypothetical protein